MKAVLFLVIFGLVLVFSSCEGTPSGDSNHHINGTKMAGLQCNCMNAAFPDPFSCYNYYECGSFGQLYHMRCPFGQTFSAQAQSCTPSGSCSMIHC